MQSRRSIIGLITGALALPVAKPAAILPAWAHEPVIVPGAVEVALVQPDGSYLEINDRGTITCIPLIYGQQDVRAAKAVLRAFGEVGPDGVPFVRTDHGEIRVKHVPVA